MMANAIAVSDSLSNAEEQIERAAKVVGRGSVRPKVFEAIYYHKTKIKTASQIVSRTQLPRMRVLQEAGYLRKNGIVNSARKDGEPAYEMIPFFQTHKQRILKLAGNPQKLAAIPTKRRPSSTVNVRVHSTAASPPRAVAITIDDIDSFNAVVAVQPDDHIPKSVSEDEFKRGIQSILNEPGNWKDWGGERFDLSSTRVVLNGHRVSAVFAFKGPGTRSPLVPGKMGKNGDQIQSMYLAEGRLFVVQFWNEVKPSVRDLMRELAVAKSAATSDTIYYTIIDGVDSHRLYKAYRSKFDPTES